MIASCLVAFTLFSSLAVGQSDSSDWPQILGANRNGVIESTVKLGWNDEPEIIWEREVGDGFAGPVMVDNQLIVFHRPGGQRETSLVVEKLDGDTGKMIWTQKIPTAYRSGMDGDAGPKATPIIHDGFVYCHGPDGELFCLSFDDGSIKWNVQTRTDYKAGTGYFGCGSTPIVIGDKILLNVGGRDNASVVAFDLVTGADKWKAVSDEASYSSPIEVKRDGQSIAVFLTRTRLLGLDPSDGTVIFSNKFGKKGPTAVASMPISFDGKLFANAAYRVGAVVININSKTDSNQSIDPTWESKSAFASHYGTPVFKDDHFYGTSGREDLGDGSFRCMEAATGNVKWDQKGFPVGHTFVCGDQLIVLDHRGGLSLIECRSDKFTLVMESDILKKKGPTRAIPAFSDGRMFVRTNAQARIGKLLAVRIAPERKVGNPE